MTNITIKTDKGDKEIELKKPKGRHIRKIWNYLMKMEEGDPKSVNEYLDYIDETTAKLANITIEELNNLDVDEKKKLTANLTDRALDSMDFMKPSQKRQS